MGNEQIRARILGYVDSNGGMPEYLMLDDVRAVAEALVAEGVLARKKETRKRAGGWLWSYTRYVRV